VVKVKEVRKRALEVWKKHGTGESDGKQFRMTFSKRTGKIQRALKRKAPPHRLESFHQ